MVKYFKGIPVIINNIISKDNKEKKYYISYNYSTRDYGVDTTALVITLGNNERQLFYILKGNHSKSYDECKNLNECVEYYKNNMELSHKYSDRLEH